MSRSQSARLRKTVPASGWQLFVDPHGDRGTVNMAIDCGLLRQAQTGLASLRLYRWNPPCLSFGRNEPASTRYDLAAIRDREIDVVRRPTGGRAVWHDQELTYAVAAPIDHFGSLRHTYLAIHDMIRIALHSIGVAATLAQRSRSSGLTRGACFASPAGGEIVVAGKKLVGSAQVREGTAFLQHGSILLDNQQDLVAELTHGDGARPHATSLQEVLDRPVAFAEVATAVTEAARASWVGSWFNAGRSTLESDYLNFDHAAWTWRR